MRLRLSITNSPPELAGNADTWEFGDTGGTIGRAERNDWRLPDPTKVISSQHAQIGCADGEFFVIDLSTNGVFLNGAETPIGRGQHAPLHNGDRLRIGDHDIAAELKTESLPAWPEAGAGAGAGADDGWGPIPTDFRFDMDRQFGAQSGEFAGGLGTAEHEAGPDLQVNVHDLGRLRAAADDWPEVPAGGWSAGADTDAPRTNPTVPWDLTGGDAGAGLDRDPARPDGPPPASARPGATLPDDWIPAASVALTEPRVPMEPVAPMDRWPEPGPGPGLSDAQPDWDLDIDAGVADATVIPAVAAPVVDPVPAAPPPPAAPVPPRPVAATPVRADPPVPAATPPAWTAPPPRPADAPAPAQATPPSQPADDGASASVATPAPWTAAPAQPVPAPSASAPPGGDLEAALAALLAGAGVPDLRPPQGASPEFFRAVGELIALYGSGSVELVQSVSSIRDTFRIHQTQVRNTDNNPLRWATPRQAVRRLLAPELDGYLPPNAAVADVMTSVVAHQIGVIRAMEAAFRAFVAGLAPAELEQRFEAVGKPGMLANRKAWCWEQYAERYKKLAEAAEENWLELLGDDFVAAYEERVRAVRVQARQDLGDHHGR